MRVVLCAMIFSCWFPGFGQLSVALQGPPTGVIQKSGLWNMALINSGTSSIQVTIGLTLLDSRTNQTVLTATTKPVLLTRGVRQLKPIDISPVNYTYNSPAFMRLGASDGLLPVGNYRACYTFYSLSGEHPVQQVLAEECVPLEVQPLSPPELSQPADTATVETPYPQFTWLPPVPVTLFTDLRYDLLVAELQAGQSPQSAIQENLPVYSALNLTQPFNAYAASYKSLDTGKVYAWRIIAKNGESYAAQSDVWTFRIAKKSVAPPVPVNGTYLTLRSSENPITTGILPNNILGLQYYSYDSAHQAQIRLTGEKGEILQTLSQQLIYGKNFIVITLNGSFKPVTTYFVEVADLQNNQYRTSFRIAK